jgi:uncharacterized protein with HEPN domain
MPCLARRRSHAIVAMMDKIQMFTAGLDFDQFVQDDKTYMAVVRAIEVSGQSAKALVR